MFEKITEDWKPRRKITKLICVSLENYEALKNIGRAGDSFNDVITMLLEKHGFVLRRL